MCRIAFVLALVSNQHLVNAALRFMTDFELLEKYAVHGSEEAFGTLVERYANLVSSAALRQTGNSQTAEEITQAVFIILARKARELNPRTILSGWLVRTTRFVALNARRGDARRRQAESEAVALHKTETDDAWRQLSAVLDEALVSLSTSDRNAVALRFFEQKKFKEMAHIMGTTEDGAQKRVSRALERLRARLGRGGVILPGAIIAGAISAKAVQTAPSALVGQLVRVGTAGTEGSVSASQLADLGMAALNAARLRKVARRGALVITALVLMVFVSNALPKWSRSSRTSTILVPTGITLSNLAPVVRTPAPVTLPFGHLLLSVIDSQMGTPVSGARITSIWDTGFPPAFTNQLTTDSQGQCDILLGPEPAEDQWNFRLEILKDSYVPKFVSWAALRGDTLEEIPTTYTAKVERGTVISGIVADERGGAIPGAFVSISSQGPWSRMGVPAEREGLALTHIEVTDEQGHWLCNHASTNLDSVIFSIAHPEYLMSTFRCARLQAITNLGTVYVEERELRTGSVVLNLKAGFPVAGLVVDDVGRPIAAARLTEEHRWFAPDANCQTTADGRFQFHNVRETGFILTARADGFQSAEVRVNPSTNGSFSIGLAKAATLRGRVLGDDGNAIPYANVAVSCTNSSQEPVCWNGWADGEGRYAWHSAPPGPAVCTIRASGYITLTDVEALPDGLEHAIMLRRAPRSRPLRITGTVTDSENSRLIPDFKVFVSTIEHRNVDSGRTTSVTLAPELRTTGKEGRFSFLVPAGSVEQLTQLNIEISADGWSPDYEQLAGPFVANREVNFKLRRLPTIMGAIQLPDGKPAAGAVVVLCATAADGIAPANAFMRLPGQIDLQLSRGSHTETDAEGNFMLPSGPPHSVFLAVHKDGFREIRLDQLDISRRIKLEPWGRVVGSLRIGASPGPEKVVSLLSLDPGEVLQVSLSVTTDRDGNFVFDGVPPGEWKVLPHSEHVNVRAGEVSTVKLGGTGRRLVGKLKGNDNGEPLAYNGYRVTVTSKWFPTLVPKRGAFTDFKSYVSAKNEWLKTKASFGQSQAGREARLNAREYSATLEADGVFAIDEVLPGTYELRVWGDPLKVDPGQMARLDELSEEIVITEPTDSGPATVDVGVLNLNAKR